jgi:hypothetical protein
MSIDFEFVSPDDKPALLALTTPEWQAQGRNILTELDYKPHGAANHDDFFNRFNRTRYQLVLIEERFASSSPAENRSLKYLQSLVMGQRRYAIVFLISEQFPTMSSIQHSVHAVIHPRDLDKLKPIVQQVVADQDLFLHVFRDAQLEITAWGK